MKDAYWFRHDMNARHDPKLLILRARFGEAGYSRYFMIVEMMREAAGYKLKADDYLYAMIGLDIGIPPEEAKRFVDACVEVGLFCVDDHIYSKSLLKRMEEKDRLFEARSYAGSKGASKRQANHQAKLKQTPSIRIEENRIEEKRGEGEMPPTPNLQEVLAECKAQGFPIDGEKFFHHYQALGWKKGATPIVDWKSALRLWANSEYPEKQTKTPPQAVSPLLQIWEAQDLILKQTEAFHTKHLIGGKCYFCGRKVDKFEICYCDEYLDGMDKVKRTIMEKAGKTYAK